MTDQDLIPVKTIYDDLGPDIEREDLRDSLYELAAQALWTVKDHNLMLDTVYEIIKLRTKVASLEETEERRYRASCD